MLNQYLCLLFVNSFKIMTFLIQFTFLACNTKSILNFEYTTATVDGREDLRKIIFKINYLKIPLDYNDDIAIIFM